MKFVYEYNSGSNLEYSWSKKVKLNSEYLSNNNNLFYRNRSNISCLDPTSGDEKWNKKIEGLKSLSLIDSGLILDRKGKVFYLCIESQELREIGPVYKFLDIVGTYNNLLVNCYGIYDLEKNQLSYSSSHVWDFISKGFAFSKKNKEDFLIKLDLNTFKEYKVSCPAKSLFYVNSGLIGFRDKETTSLCTIDDLDNIKEFAQINHSLNFCSKDFIGGMTKEGDYHLYSKKDGNLVLKTPIFDKIFMSAEKYLWVYNNHNIECIDILKNSVSTSIVRDGMLISAIGSGFIIFKSQNENEIFCYRND